LNLFISGGETDQNVGGDVEAGSSDLHDTLRNSQRVESNQVSVDLEHEVNMSLDEGLALFNIQVLQLSW